MWIWRHSDDFRVFSRFGRFREIFGFLMISSKFDEGTGPELSQFIPSSVFWAFSFEIIHAPSQTWMPRARGAERPPGPPVIARWFLRIPTPTKSTLLIQNLSVQNLKILKNKKVCSRKNRWSVTIILFMNCKIAYITYKVPLAMLYEYNR